LLKDDAEKGQKVINAIDTLQAWVMRLVRLVMKLTPYGVLALMTKVVAGSNLQDIIKLGSFVVVSYIGLGLMFVVHGVLVSAAGINPLRFFRKIWPVLTFAFTSRSSASKRRPAAWASRSPSPVSPLRSARPLARTAAPVCTRRCWR